MCGKALPFRQAILLKLRRLRLRPSDQRHSLIWKLSLVGKAKPFRTSGGRAATIVLMRCEGNYISTIPAGLTSVRRG